MPSRSTIRRVSMPSAWSLRRFIAANLSYRYGEIPRSEPARPLSRGFGLSLDIDTSAATWLHLLDQINDRFTNLFLRIELFFGDGSLDFCLSLLTCRGLLNQLLGYAGIVNLHNLGLTIMAGTIPH